MCKHTHVCTGVQGLCTRAAVQGHTRVDACEHTCARPHTLTCMSTRVQGHTRVDACEHTCASTAAQRHRGHARGLQGHMGAHTRVNAEAPHTHSCEAFAQAPAPLHGCGRQAGSRAGLGQAHQWACEGRARGVRAPTHPLLAVGVLQVVGGAVVPGQADAHQRPGQEPVLRQDHEVGEETAQRLDHPCQRHPASGSCTPGSAIGTPGSGSGTPRTSTPGSAPLGSAIGTPGSGSGTPRTSTPRPGSGTHGIRNGHSWAWHPRDQHPMMREQHPRISTPRTRNGHPRDWHPKIRE